MVSWAWVRWRGRGLPFISMRLLIEEMKMLKPDCGDDDVTANTLKSPNRNVKVVNCPRSKYMTAVWKNSTLHGWILPGQPS